MGNITEESEEVIITNESKLTQQIGALYLKEKFSDIILNLQGHKVHAHKVILAARSEYFENLLYEEKSSQTEIIINDVSPNAFEKLLKYIYTGNMTLTPSSIDLTLEVLVLAIQYSFTELQEVISKKLKSLININNICLILNMANLYDLEELKETCYNFSDRNALEIIESDCFNELSESSVTALLQRDTFFVPEVKIFKSVAKWCKVNNTINSVIKCVRLSLLSVVEIVSVVWPTKLINNEDLLGAIAEIVDVRPKKISSRGQLLLDKNVAFSEQHAEVITGTNTSFLLNGTRDVSKYASHTIGDENGITIKLKTLSFINHIHMMLWDSDSRHYSYYITISIDQKKWKNVIDYRTYHCRSQQRLYFHPEVAQYIRVIGTHNTANAGFHLIFFETYYKAILPRIINGLVCPVTNVAKKDQNATVIEGTRPEELLDGDTNYDGSNGYTYHIIGSGSITIQLAQPYIISSMKLLLWAQDDRFYRYYIETSVNKTDWETVVDRRNENCKSWQILRFKERPMIYIRITGTHNSSNNGFHCVHFECPTTEPE